MENLNNYRSALINGVRYLHFIDSFKDLVDVDCFTQIRDRLNSDDEDYLWIDQKGKVVKKDLVKSLKF